MIFWRPGNLYCDRRRASIAAARSALALTTTVLIHKLPGHSLESLVLMLKRIWPILTRATVPFGFPKAPRMPVCSLSAPAHDNILLMRTTWYGWARTRRWNASFPPAFTIYLMQNKNVEISITILLINSHLLAQIRAASSASELSCSYSFETRWIHKGNSSTFARFRPKSKIRIFGSGTPRLNLDFGYGCKGSTYCVQHLELVLEKVI